MTQAQSESSTAAAAPRIDASVIAKALDLSAEGLDLDPLPQQVRV